MTWKVVSASVVGTAHQIKGESCQDFCLVARYQTADNIEYLIALVADGAGSAKFGKHGAEFVCREGQRLIEAMLVNNATPDAVNRECIIKLISELRLCLSEYAASHQNPIRDYACTLLIAIVGPQFGVFAQIGDGGIVASRDGVLELVLWPEIGEYINETNFLTDEKSLNHIQYAYWNTHPLELALFSDGLQRLALVYETRTVHAPFFTPMLAVMRNTELAGIDSLNEQLANFLGSQRINDRTDDDKTLILALYSP